MNKKVAIIGSGNVATVLAKNITRAGHRIVQIVGRNIESTHALARSLNCDSTTNLQQLTQLADIYILTVQDKIITDIVSKISIPQSSILVHTAGAVSINVFKEIHDKVGVFYPLQSLRKEDVELTEIPIFIDGNDESTIQTLITFAKTFTNKVGLADDIKRQKLHIAAVFANNFTNYLYGLSYAFCQKEQIDFSFLLPLIKSGINKIEHSAPFAVQTGPAVRNDKNTIAKHLAVLENDLELSSVYQFLTEKILTHFGK